MRLPVRIMRKLGVEPGDYVEVIGRKSAYAQVWPAYPEDEDKEIIRMDFPVRHYHGAEPADAVALEKCATYEVVSVE